MMARWGSTFKIHLLKALRYCNIEYHIYERDTFSDSSKIIVISIKSRSLVEAVSVSLTQEP